jgi:Flp pilus assembly CpaE family ATPase
VLEALRTHYAYVIVDCSPAVDQNNLTALDMADLVLLVATPEIASLKNAARVIQLGGRLGYADAKMRLILNRFNAPGALAAGDFEPYLAQRASFRIPNDNGVARALTRGEPVVTLRGSKVGKSLDRLARTVVANAGWEDDPKPARGRGLLGFGFRRPAAAPELVLVQSGAEAA